MEQRTTGLARASLSMAAMSLSVHLTMMITATIPAPRIYSGVSVRPGFRRVNDGLKRKIPGFW